MEEIPPSEKTQRKYQISHHRSLPHSTYNKPKMVTVPCSVLQLHIFLPFLPSSLPTITPSLTSIPYLLTIFLPSFLPPFPPFSSFFPSFWNEDLCFHMGKFLYLLWGGHRGRQRKFSSCPFFFISCFFCALPHRALKSPTTRN